MSDRSFSRFRSWIDGYMPLNEELPIYREMVADFAEPPTEQQVRRTVSWLNDHARRTVITRDPKAVIKHVGPISALVLGTTWSASFGKDDLDEAEISVANFPSSAISYVNDKIMRPVAECMSPELADDGLQAAWKALYGRIWDYRADRIRQNQDGFIKTVVRNELRDLGTKVTRIRNFERPEADSVIINTPLNLAELAVDANASQSCQEVDVEDTLNALLQLARTLLSKQECACIVHAFAGESVRDSAALLKLTPMAVHTSRNRGMAKLKASPAFRRLVEELRVGALDERGGR